MPVRVVSLCSLPPKKVVQQTCDGLVGYVYASLLVCACRHAGDSAAYGRCRQEMFQRRLADEQAMTAEMNQMDRDCGPWGGPSF